MVAVFAEQVADGRWVVLPFRSAFRMASSMLDVAPFSQVNPYPFVCPPAKGGEGAPPSPRVFFVTSPIFRQSVRFLAPIQRLPPEGEGIRALLQICLRRIRSARLCRP